MIEFALIALAIGLSLGGAAAYGVTRIRRPHYHFALRETLSKDLSDLGVSLDSRPVCVVCGDPVTPRNLGAFVEVEGEYKHVCDKEECLLKYDLEIAQPV